MSEQNQHHDISEENEILALMLKKTDRIILIKCNIDNILVNYSVKLIIIIIRFNFEAEL